MIKLIKYFWIVLGGPRIQTMAKMMLMNRDGLEVDLSKMFFDNVRSSLPITIVIPAIEKDLPVLPYVIKSIKKEVQHEISKIIIVAPKSSVITETVKKLELALVDEDCVVPIKKSDIVYKAKGINRSGWLFQQLLKLGMEKWVDTQNYAVMDADTVLTKPMFFEKNGKTVFDVSDEYHKPYYDNYEKLLGIKKESKVSFVAHHMLFNKIILRKLKEEIEKNTSIPWYQAIVDYVDKSEVSGFSEYETYGNYFFTKYKKKMLLKYWHNKEVPINVFEVDRIEDIVNNIGQKYRSLSFHNYNKPE